MKKVIYIHQYFRTPEEGGAIRSFYISRALHESGYQVEIITAHNQKEYELKLVHGLKIHYLPVAYKNDFGVLRRMISFIRFIFLAKQRLSKIQKADLCYVTSTPLTVGIIALWAKKKLKLPYVFEVRDLWPEAPIQMGVLKTRLTRILAEKLELNIYRHAQKIVALSPGIHDHIRSKMTGVEIVDVPNMSDTAYYKPVKSKDRSVLTKLGVSNKFVISYFGAIGRVNQVEYLLQAAELFQKLGIDVAVLIAGEGAQRQRLMRLAEQFELQNIHFFGHLDRKGIKDMLNITDAAYVSFAGYPVLETNSPNKFFDAIAAGKMIITNTKGWLRKLIEDYDCGFYYNPHLPEDMVSRILEIMKKPELLAQQQQNARKLAEAKFDKQLLTERLIENLFPEDVREKVTEKVYISNH